MMDNEELLREGECPASNCIEELGHAGPHSGDRPKTLREKVEALKDEAVLRLRQPELGGVSRGRWAGMREAYGIVLSLMHDEEMAELCEPMYRGSVKEEAS